METHEAEWNRETSEFLKRNNQADYSHRCNDGIIIQNEGKFLVMGILSDRIYKKCRTERAAMTFLFKNSRRID